MVDVKNILIDPMEKKEEKKEERRGGFGDRRQQRRPQEKKEREEEAWIPITKLGRLVKGGYITSIEEIYKFALQIKGDHFLCDFARSSNC